MLLPINGTLLLSGAKIWIKRSFSTYLFLIFVKKDNNVWLF
jgi:hypothetical protein